jgi:hypothetical protein
MMTEERRSTAPWRGSPVNWAAIIAGAFVGVAVLMLLAALWSAVSTEWTFVHTNFKWFQMGSAFFAWLVAGFVTGWYASRASAQPIRGGAHGFVVWSVMVVARTVLAIPSALAPIGFALGSSTGNPQWATFGAIAGGLITAVLGGMLGGALHGPRRDVELGSPEYVEVPTSTTAPGPTEPSTPPADREHLV